MITMTLNSATLTSHEAGAAAAFLLALHPECLTDAIASLGDVSGDPAQLRLPLTPEVAEHQRRAAEQATPVPDAETAFASAPAPEQTAAEAFAASGAQPPEAGAPFVPPPPPVASVTEPASAPALGAPAAPAAAPAGVELDSEGLPWDARIHSSPASLTKKGPWRAKRNLNQLTEHAVKAELRAALAAPAAGTAAPAPVPAPETPAERTAREAVEQGLVSPAAPLVPAPVIPAPPVAPAPPAAPPAPVAAASAPPVSAPSPAPAAPSPAPSDDGATPPGTLFANAVRKVTAAQAAGHITVGETNAVLTHLGLAQMRDLLARPDLIPTFEASVDAHVARYPVTA